MKKILLLLTLLSTLNASAQTDLSGATVTLTPTGYDYDGTECKPKVSGIRKGTKRYNSLVEGVDYDLSYTDNVNAGEATATLTFKGDYTGVATKTFTISPKDLTREESVVLVLEETEVYYDGTEKTPKAKDIYYEDKLLIPDVDYDLIYKNNIYPGTATAQVIFKGNYSGLIKVEFFIVEDPNTEGIAINEENFPDFSFCWWISLQPYGSDYKLTAAEIASITSIDVSNKGIESLQGIEFFTALTTLYCDKNQLTSLDVSKNTALTKLSCDENQLTSLDVSNNMALAELYCYGNQLTSLVLPQNTALTGLFCNNNQLASLDVSQNTALTFLSCYNNQLTSLDVSKNTALTYMHCGSNQLTSLDLSQNTALTMLYCNNNQLTTHDVSKNSALTTLSCNENQLTSLDLSNNTALVYLYCSNNQLTSLDLSRNTNLAELNCSDNQLASLDVSKNTALTSLACGGNQLTTFDVSKNTALTKIYCYYNRLVSLDVSKNIALTTLSCYNNQLTSLTLPNNTTLGYLYLWENQINAAAMDALVASLPTVSQGTMGVVSTEKEYNVMTKAQVAAAVSKGWTPCYFYTDGKFYKYYGSDPEGVDVAVNETNFPDDNFRNWILEQPLGSDSILTPTDIAIYKNINVNGKNIQSLKGIEFFTELSTLYCYDNLLTSLDVSKNTALTKIYCYNNQLTSLDVSGCTALQLLSCFGNQFTSLDVSKNTNLTKLYCYNNQLTSLDVSQNTALQTLECQNNQLTSLNVPKNTALESLYCYNNQFTSLDMAGCTALSILSCGGNKLTSLDMSKNTNLTELYCRDNQLTSLDVSKNTALEYLGCYNNQLTSLDVSGCTALESLYCYNNQLTSIDASGCTGLYVISCYQNQIKGEGMDALVKSLPDSLYYGYYRQLRVIYNEGEGNVMTTAQVGAAKAKCWDSYHCVGQAYNEESGYYYDDWQKIPDTTLRGDVNEDGIVNGTDIQAIINLIVEGEYDEKADVNFDGVVNGTDIQEVINIIVNAE